MFRTRQADYLAVIAESAGGRTYTVKATEEGAMFISSRMTVDAYKFSHWLDAHGCEFCAHQVRLGRSIQCNHIALTTDDISELKAIQV